MKFHFFMSSLELSSLFVICLMRECVTSAEYYISLWSKRYSFATQITGTQYHYNLRTRHNIDIVMWLSIDGVWSGNWIYWTLTDINYK